MSDEIIDLHYGGRPGLVGTWLCGEQLIDCGPGSCLERLLDGLGERRPGALMLTHIHLDHAGAAGALVERWPDLPVYVHPRGAPHLIDPSRLLASARRVFGATLEPLLGEVRPVPQANVRTLEDGARVGRLRSAWTPGHASHHIAFLDDESGTAFAGDLAGVRLAAGAVVPPTPPPDIDIPRWLGSLDLLESWQAERLALAHYGEFEHPQEQIALMREALERHARWAGEGEGAFERALHEWLGERMNAQCVRDYEFVAMAEQSAVGLRRFLERDGRERAPAAAERA